MTAPVLHLDDFRPPEELAAMDSRRSDGLGKRPPAAGGLPVRLSPRPIRAAARALAGSEDARLCAWICGLCLAALFCLAFGDQLFQLSIGVHP